MDEASRRALTAIVAKHGPEIVDRATDWVRAESVDLGESAPREDTRQLVERVVATEVAALVDDDLGPLDEFVDYVTTFRARREFHVSTVLRGLLSFRSVLGPVLRRELADGWTALTLLDALDRVAFHAVFRAADLYASKINETVLQRRIELEADLARLTRSKEQELDEKIGIIEAQRSLLNILASPVLRVGGGVLVVPLIGELDDERAEVVRERILAEVVATKACVVLVDITGLAVTDAALASELLRLVGCVRLLGADAMLVGVSPDGARALASLQVRLDQVRSFMTLGDGLRVALARGGSRRAGRAGAW
jgi:rsbT co-antagonist protein RsbR